MFFQQYEALNKSRKRVKALEAPQFSPDVTDSNGSSAMSVGITRSDIFIITILRPHYGPNHCHY